MGVGPMNGCSREKTAFSREKLRFPGATLHPRDEAMWVREAVVYRVPGSEGTRPKCKDPGTKGWLCVCCGGGEDGKRGETPPAYATHTYANAKAV